MNTNENYTTANCTTMGKAQKKNFAKLPKIKYFRIQSRGGVGKIEERRERKCGAWAVLVAPEGGNGLRLASDVAFEYGMLFKCEFDTKDEAFKAAMEFKSKWGAPTSKTGKAKEEAATKVKANIITQMTEKLKAMGMTDTAIATIISTLD